MSLKVIMSSFMITDEFLSASLYVSKRGAY